MEPREQEVRRFLQKHHIRLNTNLGQHFLIDQEIINVIVDSAGIEEEDHIVEVGPGIGVLTRELLKRAGRVTSIEIDERLLPLLQDFTTPTETPFEILHSNALQVEFPKTPYKIVANIPYHITSTLLRHAFLESKTPPQSLTLLMQREVAEKICDTNNAGLLTIVVGLFGIPKIVATISPSAFLPPPKVDSAILHIQCFEKPRTTPQMTERILALVKLAFSQKRKMLCNTIGSLPDGLDRLARAALAPQRRPQTLTIEEWIQLAKAS